MDTVEFKRLALLQAEQFAHGMAVLTVMGTRAGLSPKDMKRAMSEAMRIARDQMEGKSGA